MENLRNRIDVKLVSNKKDLNKELSKVLMHEFHYDYFKNKYGNNSRLLFTDTDT